jgi:hypothetical protein
MLPMMLLNFFFTGSNRIIAVKHRLGVAILIRASLALPKRKETSFVSVDAD